ncbi:MAG: hypothetical protein ACYCWW_00255 [Deltaproteobacteria bacterium]
MDINVWTDGTTAGFNIEVDGVLRYFDSYETAHAELVRLGILAQPAAVMLDNARMKAGR